MKTSIVIPTYNEVENLKPLVDRLLAFNDIQTIWVVDDQSPDGTGEAAETLARGNGRVQVIHRKSKEGRGSACLEGFQRALKDNPEYIMEMDADFSHDPADVPRLLGEMKTADMAIGSRYLPGSQIVNWPLSRRVFSRLANIFARSVLRIPITDYTNGYRCYRRSAIESLEFEKIKASGFIVLSCIAYQLFLKGCRFREIPVRFVNRKRGTSNFSLKEVFDAWTGVLKLRWSTPGPSSGEPRD